MAKRGYESDGSEDGDMQIVFIKVKGSNETLQQGMRTLIAAMGKPVQVAPPKN